MRRSAARVVNSLGETNKAMPAEVETFEDYILSGPTDAGSRERSGSLPADFSPQRSRPRSLALPAAVVLPALLAYLGTVSFNFVYDDEGQILGNQLLGSWRHIPDFFTKNVWGFDPAQASNYYRPVFLLWLLLNRTLFGLNPAPWHLAAVTAHLVCIL
ncbi:MAG TPA: hypothetical protein VLZ81_13835, partial [Blastocatellia bacterium]|nr:hypothetical protein [Blastocatellia bacterium]